MKTVWKYTVPMLDVFSLDLPQGAKILTIQEQHGNPQIWVLVNYPVDLLETRKFRLVGTGQTIEVDNGLEYIGTFQSIGGDFIGHLFEMRDKGVKE
ncbi:hypothetical protein KAU11_07985 [Candidatus Babeliales bacterium]|nr:hypothetical protein [Candidatus Babeliales bacterium]